MQKGIDLMKKSDRILIALSIRILAIVLVSLGVGLFFVPNQSSYIKGLIFGTLFTLVKLKLMENTITRAVQKPEHQAALYSKIHYFMRYILSLLVMIIAVMEPSISLVGVIIPQLAMKLAAYWYGYNEKETPKDGSVEFLEWEDDEEPSDFF